MRFREYFSSELIVTAKIPLSRLRTSTLRSPWLAVQGLSEVDGFMCSGSDYDTGQVIQVMGNPKLNEVIHSAIEILDSGFDAIPTMVIPTLPLIRGRTSMPFSLNGKGKATPCTIAGLFFHGATKTATKVAGVTTSRAASSFRAPSGTSETNG